VAKSIYHSRGWLKRLISGPIERLAELPRVKFPMLAPRGPGKPGFRWSPL